MELNEDGTSLLKIIGEADGTGTWKLEAGVISVVDELGDAMTFTFSQKGRSTEMEEMTVVFVKGTEETAEVAPAA